MSVASVLDANPMTESVSNDSPSEGLMLARAAAAGDTAATAKLLRMVAPKMMRVVRAMLGSQHPDVDDVLQQALIGLVRALPAFRGECDPAGYASTIAVRKALAVRKRGRVERGRRDDDAVAEDTRADGPSPGDEAVSAKRKALLRDLLADIPEEQAEALALRTMLGWSLEEIAENAGAPINTIRSRLRLAKEALRKRIEADPSLLEALEVTS
ncbi:MAG: RNA polymerase sigma factor [Polyangiaceae bacterium]